MPRRAHVQYPSPTICGRRAPVYSYRPNGTPVAVPTRSTTPVVMPTAPRAAAARATPQRAPALAAVVVAIATTTADESARRWAPPLGTNGVAIIAAAVTLPPRAASALVALMSLPADGPDELGHEPHLLERRHAGPLGEHVVPLRLALVEDAAVQGARRADAAGRAVG